MKQYNRSQRQQFRKLTGFKWNESVAIRDVAYAFHFLTIPALTSENIVSYVDRALKLVGIEPDIDRKVTLLAGLEIRISSYQEKLGPIQGPLYKIGPIYERL